MSKTAALGLRIEPELKQALENAANADGRTMASYVERVLVDHLQGLDRKATAAAISHRIVTKAERRDVSVIVAEVLSQFPGITWEEIVGVSRRRELIAPRDACVWAVYQERKDMSLPQIGKLFDRDHTTILYSIRKTAAANA